MTHPHRLRSIFLCLCCALTLVLAGCDLSGDDGGGEEPPAAAGVIVGNGGPFGGQGSLTIYDPQDSTTVTREGAGGFVAGLALREDELFALVNSADLINRYATANYTQTGQVQNPRPPRGIAFAEDGGTAYVTNLSVADFETGEITVPGTVSVVDLETNTVAGDLIEVGDFPEGIVVAAGKAFTANSGLGGTSQTLTVIDTETNAVSGTIDVGCDGPDELFVDGEGELVVVCLGKASFVEGGPTNGQVVFVDPETEQVTGRVELDRGVGSANGSQSAYYAAESEGLFVIDGQDTVFGIDTDRNAQTGTVTVPAAGDLVGLTAVAFDEGTGRLYVARLPVGDDGESADFSSEGAVVILGPQGAQVGRFGVGIAPSHIALWSRE